MVAFECRKLKDHEGRYPTHDLELHAIIHALNIWSYYLLRKPFELRSNHQSLRYIFTQPNLNARKRRWMELLTEYNLLLSISNGRKIR